MKHMKPVLGIVVIVILIGVGIAAFGVQAGPSKYDPFAQCLTDAGVKMYGAYWCPHCAEQKAMFGGSWKYVDYIECSLPNRAGQTQFCTDAGIQSYPTWEFADSSRTTGTLSLSQLANRTGCQLPIE